MYFCNIYVINPYNLTVTCLVRINVLQVMLTSTDVIDTVRIHYRVLVQGGRVLDWPSCYKRLL